MNKNAKLYEHSVSSGSLHSETTPLNSDKMDLSTSLRYYDVTGSCFLGKGGKKESEKKTKKEGKRKEERGGIKEENKKEKIGSPDISSNTLTILL